MITILLTFGLGLAFGASVLVSGVVAVMAYIVACWMIGAIKS